jgi:hypothetical protein
MNRDGAITVSAQSAAQHVMFEFMLRLLDTAIAHGRTPEEQSDLARLLREAARLHRGENLTLPHGSGLEDEKLPLASAAFRDEIQRRTERLLQQLGAGE